MQAYISNNGCSTHLNLAIASRPCWTRYRDNRKVMSRNLRKVGIIDKLMQLRNLNSQKHAIEISTRSITAQPPLWMSSIQQTKYSEASGPGTPTRVTTTIRWDTAQAPILACLEDNEEIIMPDNSPAYWRRRWGKTLVPEMMLFPVMGIRVSSGCIDAVQAYQG